MMDFNNFLLFVLLSFIQLNNLYGLDANSTNTTAAHELSMQEAMKKLSDKGTITIATIIYEPWTIANQKDPQKPTGYIPDIINSLTSRLGVAVKWTYNDRFGYYNPSTKAWTGLIDDVIKNKAYMAAAPLTITSSRRQKLNFSIPFKSSGLQILMKKSYLHIEEKSMVKKLFTVFQPISKSIWFLTLVSMFIVGLLLHINNRLNPYEWKNRQELGRATASEGETFKFFGSLWFAFSTMVWQGYERAPRSIAARVLSCIWMAFMTLLIITYIGSLVVMIFWNSSIHAQDLTSPPARDLAHLLLDKKIEIGCINKSSTFYYIKTNTDDPVLSKLYQRWKNDSFSSLVDSTQEGVNKTREGNYAFITESLTAEYYANQKPCDLSVLGPVFGKRSFGFPISHNVSEEERSLWDMVVLQLIESGESDDLEHKWWRLHGDCWSTKKMEKATQQTRQTLLSSKPQRIDMDMFYLPIVILFVGIILSLCCGAAEILYYKYKGRYDEGSNYQRNNLPNTGQLSLDNDESFPT